LAGISKTRQSAVQLEQQILMNVNREHVFAERFKKLVLKPVSSTFDAAAAAAPKPV